MNSTTEQSSDYTFRLDEHEVERFRAMAANAQRHEGRLWQRAGIVQGATVVDLGCGPGALLPLLAERIGREGTIWAVDADPQACANARRVAARLATPVHVVTADAARTGLGPRSADVVMCRNVLVHNGRRAGEFLTHAASLLRPGGMLLSAEPDLVGLDFGAAHEEREYEVRWQAMLRADGSDPALGAGDTLAQLLRQHGWTVTDHVQWTDRLAIERSPAWAAARAVAERGFATEDELEHWQRALARRQEAGQLLHCALTMTAVLAEPEPAAAG
jgi:SAM-dependent methyltransferase